MSNKADIEPFYQRRGAEVVDLLFDHKMINPDWSRKDLQELEDYLAYLFQSHAEMSAKTAVMLEKVKK